MLRTQSATGLDQVFLSTNTTPPSPRKSSAMKRGHRKGAFPNEIPATGDSVSTTEGGCTVIALGVAAVCGPAAAPPPLPPGELDPLPPAVTVAIGVGVGVLPPPWPPQLLVQPGVGVGQFTWGTQGGGGGAGVHSRHSDGSGLSSEPGPWLGAGQFTLGTHGVGSSPAEATALNTVNPVVAERIPPAATPNSHRRHPDAFLGLMAR